jgi:hypothetical protein
MTIEKPDRSMEKVANQQPLGERVNEDLHKQHAYRCPVCSTLCRPDEQFHTGMYSCPRCGQQVNPALANPLPPTL